MPERIVRVEPAPEVVRFFETLKEGKMPASEYAQLSGVSGVTVSRWLNGRAVPSAALVHAFRLLLGLGMTPMGLVEHVRKTS